MRQAWHVIEPGNPYIDGWVLHAIAEHLEAVTAGDIKRLLINVPPGMSKSTLTSVMWPAWEWGPQNLAHYRIISTSHSERFSIRDTMKMRRLIASPWYQARWGEQVKLVRDQNAKTKFENTASGFREAAAAGSLTGSRGDRLIIDDPLSVEDARSDAIRQNREEWFLEAVPTRLNNPSESAIIVIMQRLHEQDTSGIILDKNMPYEHLMLPMRYEPHRHCSTAIGFEDPRTEDGELLFPARFPAEYIEDLEHSLGPYGVAGQLQQRPEPRGGGIIKREYWRLWDRAAQQANDIKPGTYPPFEYILASFDGAFTEKAENDYSALTVLGVWIESTQEERDIDEELRKFGRPRIMLIDAWRKKLTLHGKTDVVREPDEDRESFEQRRRADWGIVEHIAATCRKWKVDKLLIESKATGHTVAQEMRRLYSRENWTVQLCDPGKLDKTARVYAIQHLFADGVVWRPDTEWAEMVETECAAFPRGAHDDLVDTISMGLSHLRKMNLAVRATENRGAVEEMVYPSKPQRRRLYEA